ncbi:MAG: DNA repair protein RecO [Cytophagales bacterium]|nr:DNA repair protein RecO [Armatimonadota bacterium]
MAVYKTNALVLRRIPLSETDKILTLFTREYGKLSAVAKGSRRTTSRLSGATEPLMLLRALLAEGMNLDVVTQAEIRESFPLVRGDFGLFLRATYACELLDRLTVERDPAPEAFDLLLSTLYVLQRAVDPDAALHAYELQLMAQVGYEPRLDACVRCERDLISGDLSPGGFSPTRGGVLCLDCAAQAREEVLPFTLLALHTVIGLANQEDARALAATEIPIEARDAINRALRAHLRLRLERDVKSTAFLDALRIGAMDDLLSAPMDSQARD